MGALIAYLVTKGVARPFATVLAYGGVLLAIGAALWWLRADAYADGKRDADADWVAASNRLLKAAQRAQDAADLAAEARQSTNDISTEELRREAAKGTDTPVGPGTAGVLERMREQQGR